MSHPKESTKHYAPVVVKHDTPFSRFRTQNKQNIVMTENGEEFPVDLLIAADGSNSTVRKLIHPTINPISHRGYEVYRGHVPWYVLSSSNKITFTAFQTWGDGARFAAVETKTGIAWFAALTNKAPSLNVKDSYSTLLNNFSSCVSSNQYENLL